MTLSIKPQSPPPDIQTNAESTESSRPSLAEELAGYEHAHELHMADRDGDYYYVECPECHSLDIRPRRFFACGKCFTFFNLYMEDGHRRVMLRTQDSWLSNHRGDMKVIWLEGRREGTPVILYGRNDHKDRLNELKKIYPKMSIETIYRDYRGGMDAHGHSRYEKYLVIPRESSENIKAIEALTHLNEGLTRQLMLMNLYCRYVKDGGDMEFEKWAKEREK